MPRHYKPSIWSRLFGAFKRRVPPPSPRPMNVAQHSNTEAHADQNSLASQAPAAPADDDMTKGHKGDINNVTSNPRGGHSTKGNTLVILETPSRSLVLGLKWQTIVVDQRRNPDAALSIARKSRASYYAPGVKGVVGFGVPDAQAKERLARFSRTTKDSSGQRRTAPVCAALLAASQVQNAIFALPLPTQDPHGLVWLLHVQGGRPAGTERVVPTDVAMDLIQNEFAPLLLDSSGQASPQLWSELPVPVELRSSIKTKPYSIRDLAQLPVLPSMHLLPASYQAELAATIRRLPLLVKFGAVCGALGFLGYSAYHQLFVAPAQQAVQAARQREQLDQLDMAQQQLGLRRKALLASLAPDVSLGPLRSRLDELPLTVAGWALRTVICDAALGTDTTSPAERTQKTWGCAADYEVTNRERFAPYAQLVDFLPTWAKLKTTPPTKFSLTFQVQTQAALISLESLPTVAEMDMGYVSQLQQHLKFLKDAVEIKFSALTLEVPRGHDGAVIPLPANFVLPQRSALVFTSPVSQVDAILSALPPAADWRGLRLNVPSPDRAQEITISLTGALYAK